MSEARIKQLEARVKELEDAIGVCVPSLLRVLLKELPENAVLDREVTEKVLARVNAAMDYKKLISVVHRGMGSDLMASCGTVHGISGDDQVRLTYVDEQVTCNKCLELIAEEIVSVAPCGSCGNFVIYKTGNHHPWCLHCMYDQFDWSGGYSDITRKEAEEIVKRGY
jgi:hypothetical protein